MTRLFSFRFAVITYTATLFLCPKIVCGQKDGITRGNVPQWVENKLIDYSKKDLDNEAEDGYVDYVYEKQVDISKKASFHRLAIKFITETGIQNGSQVSIDFDPTYQRLIMHKVALIRNGRTIDKLDLGKVKAIQQEQGLEEGIFNGGLTAILFVEDVRKGDILEYSYTLVGANPIFRNNFCDEFPLAFPVPVYYLSYKATSPTGKPLHCKTLGNAGEGVKRSQTEEGIVYEWERQSVHPVRAEDRLPGWYAPFPMLMVSSFASWRELNAWALTLFPPAPAIGKGLSEKIASLRALPNDSARIMAALRFVQDEIRYLGIELGAHSHLPNDPNVIFQQRFGDCKDKSYLLCTILHKLGIPAWPVLINTRDLKAIDQWQPSYYCFNHCVAKVQWKGKAYYFDATINFQRGPLDATAFPDYQRGLVVADSTDKLTKLFPLANGSVTINEDFTLHATGGLVSLKVGSVYTGSYADDNRSGLMSNSKYGIQKSLKDFYADRFGGISVADSFSIQDDAVSGMFKVTEKYSLTDIWERKAGIGKAVFYPFIIAGHLKGPKDNLDRKMPFSIPFPSDYVENITLHLPEPWDLETKHLETSCRAFLLKADFVRLNDTTLFLRYTFHANEDHVDPSDAKAALDAIADFDTKMAYSIAYRYDADPEQAITTSFPQRSGNGNIFQLLVLVGTAIAILIVFTQIRQKGNRG